MAKESQMPWHSDPDANRLMPHRLLQGLCLSLHRPSGDGGSHDVFTSLPGNCHFRSRGLETALLELWLGILVSTLIPRAFAAQLHNRARDFAPSAGRTSFPCPPLPPSAQGRAEAGGYLLPPCLQRVHTTFFSLALRMQPGPLFSSYN